MDRGWEKGKERKRKEGGTGKGGKLGKGENISDGGSKYEVQTWTPKMSTTTRGSTSTEFHR